MMLTLNHSCRTKLGLGWQVCLAVLALPAIVHADETLRINQVQFVGSHNSYKMAMSAPYALALRAQNAQAADALQYAHVPLKEQLDLGVRKLELDVFYDVHSEDMQVGHVQQIDMNSHCTPLSDCLRQIREWSEANPQHIPIWISFNAKDQYIEGLPRPQRFDESAFALLDQLLEQGLGDRLIRPKDVLREDAAPIWPTLASARGQFLLILDEGDAKRSLYWGAPSHETSPKTPYGYERTMFTNVPLQHPAAAVMVINDPISSRQQIQDLVRAGYMVRTRADADTVEARTGDVRRRDEAFASGAQAVSTDYYLPADFADVTPPYHVAPAIRCNPVTTDEQHSSQCSKLE